MGCQQQVAGAAGTAPKCWQFPGEVLLCEHATRAFKSCCRTWLTLVVRDVLEPGAKEVYDSVRGGMGGLPWAAVYARGVAAMW